MADFAKPGFIKDKPGEIETVQSIYQAYEMKSDNGWRPHLGASVIGRKCNRELWSIFRWVTETSHNGRLLRLFDTGNHEEPRLVKDLRATGATCYDVDPETGRQFRVQAHGGHFGGSMDGAALGLKEDSETWHVCEFKTHNDKSFHKLLKEGVEKSKPEHFAQMQIYMHLTEMDRALYLSVNKNDDTLYGERINYDKEISEKLLDKAGQIIFAQNPPTRITEDAAFWKCKFCDHWENCHGGQLPARNCRTCLHSTPTKDGEWICEQGEKPVPIPLDVQMVGCQHQRFIPRLVSGEQEDVVHGNITYKMRDGRLWEDNGT